MLHHDREPGGPSILIVEDDTDIGTLLVEIIHMETPYHAELVPDAHTALEHLETHIPRLLLLDYHLPGMNGLALYDHLQTNTRLAKLPALMMSADLPVEGLRSRGIPGIRKPFALHELIAQIETIMEQNK